ncbi:hypothetical protein CBY09_10875 [Acidovorax kalamii]|uniref:SMODS and SLOG-associating 2TM effector domain-containing protein n=2 Tax=Acidovorax kalamii TaxID=2004485 RepID=A0A235EP39_9BURK|nr:hypothetical protein CBY09_10875 [Acidovorax kalamii]
MPWPIGPRVEDPIRIKEFTSALNALRWDITIARASLATVFDELGRLAHAEIRYYYARRKVAGWRGAWFRGLAWLFGTAGVLVPVIHPILLDPPKTFLSFGYLAIAGAGALLVADSVFGGSAAHGRFTTTQLKLEHVYEKFSLEWQVLLAAYDAQPEAHAAVRLLERAISFVDALHGEIASETAAWKVTLQEIKEELERQQKAKPAD